MRLYALLRRGDKKRVFTDSGKSPSYACVGPQVSRNSQEVLDYPAFMNKLPLHHWRALLWLMRWAEEAYKEIADHQVISQIHHAKNAVPFKTFATTDPQQASSNWQLLIIIETYDVLVLVKLILNKISLIFI